MTKENKLNKCPYDYIKEKLLEVPTILRSNGTLREKTSSIYTHIRFLHIDNYSNISESVKQKMREIHSLYAQANERDGEFSKRQENEMEKVLELIADLYDQVKQSCCR